MIFRSGAKKNVNKRKMIQRNFKSDKDTRRRQIDTLKIFNDNVQEVIECEEYTVGFESDGRPFVITVFLGPSFPNEKPKVVISPSVEHPWVFGPTGEVNGAPGLLNFTAHSDLGRIVQAIIREMEKFPPQLFGVGEMMNRSGNEAPQIDIPHPPQSGEGLIPELRSLTIEELKELDTDPEFLDDFVAELGAVKNLRTDLDVLLQDIESIAKANMAQEERMTTLREEVNRRSIEFRDLGDKYEMLCALQKKKAEEFSPQHIKELLQIAASISDSECETCAEEFLAGKIDVQSFLNTFMAAKKLSAMRKAKEERLTSQLDSLEKHSLH
ncbi:vacuolar protein sorting-associated protein 37A [Lutzomyia longipalpis]|uniref:vacuolar protein sorting-associated protein 37A n=1 Tax=Lutzomyia longipalpis TaxID=7200 RepID=UPI002483E793|nr:vacuolar protein sorting-associated protein 37A [Lutzomyia longipalpis]